MNPSNLASIETNFKQKGNVFTCKLCNKMLKIEESGSGTLSTFQRQFLILTKHLEKDCK